MKNIFIMIIGLLFIASAIFASGDMDNADSSLDLVGNILVGVEILMIWYLLSHIKIIRKIFKQSFGFLILIAILLRFIFNNSLDDQSVGILVFLMDIIFMAFLSYLVSTIYKFKCRV